MLFSSNEGYIFGRGGRLYLLSSPQDKFNKQKKFSFFLVVLGFELRGLGFVRQVLYGDMTGICHHTKLIV
jgi:hypothetical protein